MQPHEAIGPVDPQVAELVEREDRRQADTLMMIPSENTPSRAVMQALATNFSNKYAEGYPGKRYYQGNEVVDDLERLAQERAKILFDVPYVNVQPLSGSPANLAVYVGLLQPGDTFMGLSLEAGGHLTHGAKASATSKFFHSESYGLKPDGYIDYDALEQKAMKVKPKIIVAGTTAYPRRLDWLRFREIADKSDAILMADIAHLAGLVVGEAYPSPVPYVDVVTTTTHKTLRGPRGAIIMVTERGLTRDSEMGNKIDKAVFPGLQGGPHENTIAAIAVALYEASASAFREYAVQIVKNARALAEGLTSDGLELVTGGTDSHLVLVDLRNTGLLGNTVAEGLEAAGIVVNRNTIPFDPNPPYFPSGIRLGTPALTSRDMREEQMRLIAFWISEAVGDLSNTKAGLHISGDGERDRSNRDAIIAGSEFLPRIRTQVETLCQEFPIKETY